MKKFTILFLIIPIISLGQKRKTSNLLENAVGITYSYDFFSDRALKTSASNQTLKDMMVARNKNEIHRATFTAGLNYVFWNTGHLAFETGILFSDRGYNTKEQSGGYSTSTPNLPVTTFSSYHYQYIDIPFKAVYYIFYNKQILYDTWAISPSFLISQKNIVANTYNDGRVTMQTSKTDSVKINKINATIFFSVGSNLNLGKKIYIKIEPNFKRTIFKIIQSPIREYLYSFGINTGIYMKL